MLFCSNKSSVKFEAESVIISKDMIFLLLKYGFENHMYILNNRENNRACQGKGYEWLLNFMRCCVIKSRESGHTTISKEDFANCCERRTIIYGSA